MKKIMIIIFFAASTNVNAQWVWANSAGSAGWDYAGLDYGSSTISTDQLGNSYITGLFNGPTMTFNGGITLTTTSSPKVFVAKYNTNGICLWARQFGGNDPDIYGNKGEAIDIDNAGNCYVTGTFHGTPGSVISVGGAVTLTGTGNRQIFVVKYDPTGTAIWATQPTGNINANHYAKSITSDYLGNSYITGYLGSSGVQFGTTAVLTGPGAYITKYGPTGNAIWAKKIGNTGNVDGMSVEVDPYDNSYITGYFQGTETFPSGPPLTSIGNRDVFLAKYDPSGVFVWVKQFGFAGSTSYGRGISTDSYGNIFLTGDFSSKIVFGSNTLVSSGGGNSEAFVSKFDNNGICLWAIQSTNSQATQGNSIKASPNGECYVAGHYSGSTAVNFNGTISPFVSNGRRYTFVVKFDINGIGLWGERSGLAGGAAESPMGISYDALYNIYIAGNVQGAAQFGTLPPLTAYGGYDAFIAKINRTSPVNISCPNNRTESSCQSQSTIDAAFAVWKAAFSYTGGCGTTVTDLSGFTAPGNCGGSVTIPYTVTSTCGQTQSCTKTFTVTADNTPPVIAATGNNDPLGCNPTATQIEGALGSATATDNCSVGTLTASDGPITGTCTKSQTRTWNVSDACNNAATPVSRTATWVVDLTPPVFTICPQDINVTVCTINNTVTYNVVATDNCSSPVLSYTFSGATTASGGGTGSGSLFLSGVTLVTVTATDACGNIKTCSFNVTVNLNPEINISICTGPTTTIYRGTTSGVGPFGPQSLTLTSTITGGTPGYSYSWSPSTGLNNPNIANPVASPAVTTTYVLTVTDSWGCTRSLGITINVRPLSDAVCSGNGNNVKFNVCHIPPGNPSNPQNICISVNALPPHLVSGTNGHNNCYLGPCGQQLCFSTTPGSAAQAPAYSQSMNPVIPVTNPPVVEEIPAEIKDEFSVQVNPNPSTGDFIIQVFSRSNEPIMVRILDNTGVVRSVNSLASKANSIKVGGNLIGGIYIAEVTQGTNRKILKLMKLN